MPRARQPASSSADSSSTASTDSGAHEAAGSAVDIDQAAGRAGRGPESTDDSDRDGDRAGAAAAPAKVRKRRRPQGSAAAAPAAAADAASKDGDGADRGPRGGGYNGGSTKHIPCKFYRHGNCTAGSACFFSHDVGLIADKAVCKYFVKGNCRYGNKCALLHAGQGDGAGTAAARSQKAQKAGGQNNTRRAADSNGGGAAARGNPRSALGTAAAAAKKERRGNLEAALSHESSESTGSSVPVSQAQSSGPQSTADDLSRDGSAVGRSMGGTWTLSTVGAAMNRDYELFGGSQDAAGSGSGLDARSQPIPKPTSFSRRALNGGGEDGALGYGGLSLHESMQIDSLALSHGAAHHSFAGSPFMTSSIPLLDHFRDISRGEAGSLGTSPRGQSFARSPIAGTPGLLLNRHAFTVIDHADSLGALDTDSLPGSPRHGRHYTSMFPLQPELSPVAAAHSIPHSGDLFGRPLRPGSILNEPLSPLSALGDSSAAPTGRLRSNSHILSPPPLLSAAGRSPGVDLGPGASSMLGAYSLNDAQGLPLRRPHDAEASIWDTYGGGLGKSLFDQQQSRWPPLASSVSALPASLHPSSFSTGLPAGGLRASLGESPMLGAIGQQRSQKQQQQKQGGLAASFAGLGSTGMFGRGSPHPGNASANGSSAASDHVDDLFELEQDAPANTRAGPGAALAPNPQFISMEGFGQMFSGLALARPENTANGSEPQPIATANPLSSGLSAISRPAA